MAVLVGTSGWQYRDWRHVLYPPGLPERDWLEHYASRYATVENNGTFYRLPAPETFAGWRARTPDGFVMTVKASRYLTHVRRLRDPAEPVGWTPASASSRGSRAPRLPAAGSGSRWNPGTSPGGRRKPGRFCPGVAPPSAGQTGSAGR